MLRVSMLEVFDFIPTARVENLLDSDMVEHTLKKMHNKGFQWCMLVVVCAGILASYTACTLTICQHAKAS